MKINVVEVDGEVVPRIRTSEVIQESLVQELVSIKIVGNSIASQKHTPGYQSKHDSFPRKQRHETEEECFLLRVAASTCLDLTGIPVLKKRVLTSSKDPGIENQDDR